MLYHCSLIGKRELQWHMHNILNNHLKCVWYRIQWQSEISFSFVSISLSFFFHWFFVFNLTYLNVRYHWLLILRWNFLLFMLFHCEWCDVRACLFSNMVSIQKMEEIFHRFLSRIWYGPTLMKFYKSHCELIGWA